MLWVVVGGHHRINDLQTIGSSVVFHFSNSKFRLAGVCLTAENLDRVWNRLCLAVSGPRP